jgi:hypothetical protein
VEAEAISEKAKQIKNKNPPNEGLNDIESNDQHIIETEKLSATAAAASETAVEPIVDGKSEEVEKIEDSVEKKSAKKGEVESSSEEVNSNVAAEDPRKILNFDLNELPPSDAEDEDEA